MLSGDEVVSDLLELGTTHVVWVPDSVMGKWESAIESSVIRLVRVCREGEAWPLAAGLYAGGARPLVMMQSTGLFESGDALRNALFDLRVPLYAIIGMRNSLNEDSPDSARRFAPQVIEAWGIDHLWVQRPADRPHWVEHCRRCGECDQPGMTLLAEGSG